MNKIMLTFALMLGVTCARAQHVNQPDSTAQVGEKTVMTKDVYSLQQEDGDLYHGLTRKLTFDRMIPPYGLEVTSTRPRMSFFHLRCVMWI